MSTPVEAGVRGDGRGCEDSLSMSQNLTESAHAVTAKEMPSALGFHLGLSAVGSAPWRVSVPFAD